MPAVVIEIAEPRNIFYSDEPAGSVLLRENVQTRSAGIAGNVRRRQSNSVSQNQINRAGKSERVGVGFAFLRDVPASRQLSFRAGKDSCQRVLSGASRIDVAHVSRIRVDFVRRAADCNRSAVFNVSVSADAVDVGAGNFRAADFPNLNQIRLVGRVISRGESAGIAGKDVMISRVESDFAFERCVFAEREAVTAVRVLRGARNVKYVAGLNPSRRES